MTPTQAQWKKLQKRIHSLQRKCVTPEELRQLAEVLTLIETHLYLPETAIISSDKRECHETPSANTIALEKAKIGL